MNTAQLITAVAGIVPVVGAIVARAWLNQRALERQIEAFRNEVAVPFATVRAELNTVRAEISTVRAEVKAGNDRTERIEQQLDQILKPVLPWRSGD